MIRIRGGYGNVYGRRRVGSGGIFVDFVYACHRHGGARGGFDDTLMDRKPRRYRRIVVYRSGRAEIIISYGGAVVGGARWYGRRYACP